MKLGTFTYNGMTLMVREGTSDRKSAKEVLTDTGYEKTYFKIESGERWLDAGANIGAFSILCALRGASSVGYEAEPNNSRLANTNLSTNGLPETVVNAAIVPDTYQHDSVALWLHHTDYGAWRHTLYKRTDKQKKVKVPAVKISEAIKQADCVKLDIEGAEIEILETIKSWEGVKKLVFEYHFDTDNRVSRYRNIVDRLTQAFNHVKAPSIKQGVEYYTFFPPAKVVYCWND